MGNEANLWNADLGYFSDQEWTREIRQNRQARLTWIIWVENTCEQSLFWGVS